MKHLLLLTVLAMSCVMTVAAVENDAAMLNEMSNDDTTEDIIKRKTKDNGTYESIEELRNVWDKTIYLNLSLNNTKISSKEFPTPVGPVPNEFKRDLGFGLQMGKTFNFHKQPLGSVLFIGLDYSWMDFNFNTYKATEAPFILGEDDPTNYKYLPWHNKKMTLDYGMSLGPSLTFYPFTSLGKSGTDKIRLNLFFHVGYDIGVAMIKNVGEDKAHDEKGKTEYAFGHGLFTSFGGSLTWDFVGLGFDIRNDGSIKYKNIGDDYGSGEFKMKQKTTRIYLQFRF